jgi:phosphate transport system substrate-binding protein
LIENEYKTSVALAAVALAAVALATVAIVVSACGRPPDGLKVRVTGASTLYPIVMMAGEELKSRGWSVEAQAGGSSRGFEDTITGRNDLGAMARELTAEEEAQVRKFPIAHDGVAVMVHASNPVAGLTTEDLRRIYRKEIDNWKELGGDDDVIVVVTKAAGHATLEVFLEHTGLAHVELAVDVVGGDNAQVLRVVANTEGAIGYVSMGEAIHSIEAGMPLRLLALDGVEPTLAAVADGRYPMVRTLYLISREEPREASRVLLDFLAGDDGRRVIERGRYVPLD